MHLGHIGIALAVRPVVPKVSFGVILIGTTFLDILTGIFSLVGIERMEGNEIGIFPWSHGLFMASIWTLMVIITSRFFSYSLRDSILLGGVVFSHWILDFISHPMGFGKKLPPDIPLFFENSPLVGLGLFNSILAALVTEFGLLIIGCIIYLKTTYGCNKVGKWSLLILIFYVFLILIPPVLLPKEHILLSTLFYLPLLPLGFWMDKHRIVSTAAEKECSKVQEKRGRL